MVCVVQAMHGWFSQQQANVNGHLSIYRDSKGQLQEVTEITRGDSPDGLWNDYQYVGIIHEWVETKFSKYSEPSLVEIWYHDELRKLYNSS